MSIDARVGLFLLVSMFFTGAASAQKSSPLAQPATDRIYLDVVVTPKSGPPVSGLQQEDFTVLDNKVPVTLTSFEALGGSRAPLEVMLVVDNVNTSPRDIALERSAIDKLLHADGGNLGHPTALAFLTDAGIEIQEESSTDGNALSALLNQHTLGVQSIPRSRSGAADRFHVSVESLYELATREASRPGRKIVLWISPGWSLFSSPRDEAQIGTTQRQRIFRYVVTMSTLLRQGRVTLYSINPLGIKASIGRAFDWEADVKGVSKVSQAGWGNVALQVIATQSGGLALNGNDIAALLQSCLADTQAYYELSFAPLLDQKPDEYHHLEVRLAKPGLTARTRQGYYSQPPPHY